MRRSIAPIPAILVILTLAACGRASGPPVVTAVMPVPAETSASAVISTTLPAPTAAHTPARGRACAKSELPEAAAGVRVTMEPGPGIPASTAAGELLEIAAVIYTQDCLPLAGLQINLWQTDPVGIYGPGHGTDNMQCCFYLGSVTTDENGRFDIQTMKPGVYANEASPPPAHIHVEALHPDLNGWETEIVFVGDPHLSATLPPGMVAIQLEQRSPAGVRLLFGEAEIITPLGGTEAGQATAMQATAAPDADATATPLPFRPRRFRHWIART